jgi:hypothetical protein
MGMGMHKFESIMSNDIMREFKKIRGRTLMNHSFNSCSIEAAISIASVFCPEIIEVGDYIFISEFYNGNIDSLEKEFNKDRKKIEMWVNSWALADFFREAYDNSVDNDKILEEFGKAIKHFWSLRFRDLFPDRNIAVEIGDNMLGETGLAVTVYQA